jgi:MFS family permease
MSTTAEHGPGGASPPGADASIGELVKQLSEQSSRLARQELELAKAELATKGKRAGIGAGMFGGAGLFGLYAVGALVAAAVLGLATAVAAWLAALIVAAVLAAIAGVLALQGKTKIAQATPPIPEQATESVKEDVQWAKSRAQSARR